MRECSLEKYFRYAPGLEVSRILHFPTRIRPVESATFHSVTTETCVSPCLPHNLKLAGELRDEATNESALRSGSEPPGADWSVQPNRELGKRRQAAPTFSTYLSHCSAYRSSRSS